MTCWTIENASVCKSGAASSGLRALSFSSLASLLNYAPLRWNFDSLPIPMDLMRIRRSGLGFGMAISCPVTSITVQ